MASIKEIFDKKGMLAEAIEGYSPRKAQVDMATAVNKAIKNKSQLVIEAGTGTGKTFAYLVPALLSDKKVIISTGTKALQEQLYHRDLPFIKEIVRPEKVTALLKGRSNYLCIHRLDQIKGNSTLLDKETLNDLVKVREWAISTKSGDMGDIESLKEDSRVFPYVTSTVDNCLGKDCEKYDDCYLVKARAKAMAADLIVVNHHLFFADLALKDTGFGELIPEAQTIVFDEAHQVPDIATEYFGEQVSTRQVLELCRDVDIEYRTNLKDSKQLSVAADKLKSIAQELRLLFPDNPERGRWPEQMERADVQRGMADINEALTFLSDVVKMNIGRSKDIDAAYERCCQIKSKIAKLNDVEKSGFSYWYETTPKHVILHITPLSIAEKFEHILAQSDASWIYTSATLMVNGGFEHFTRQMGIKYEVSASLPSPFDYQEQSMLCVPRFMPEPSDPAMLNTLTDIAQQLVKASDGRCFLLFTSHRMMQNVARTLEPLITNPIMVQGSKSKRVLIQDYTQSRNGVLLGTASFWEGVDVRGDDLVCVLIDKLPFAAPDEPLLQARTEECKKRGGDPFAEIQIPEAVIALKQGAGRLIRDRQDFGALVICDNRLITRDYGKTFVSSLPPMKRTRDITKVTDFLRKLKQKRESAQSQSKT